MSDQEINKEELEKNVSANKAFNAQDSATFENGSLNAEDNVVDLNETDTFTELNNTQGSQNLDSEAQTSNGEVKVGSEIDYAKECEQMRLKIKTLEEQAAANKDQMLRVLAEAENIKRRAQNDIDREKKFALEKFVKAIIPVYDALDKALELSNREDPATKATLDGVEGTISLLVKELNGFGVEIVNPVGEAFDPNFHQAISMVPSADVKPNHVLAVMQKGFVLNGRVVRAATVVVAKAMDA